MLAKLDKKRKRAKNNSFPLFFLAFIVLIIIGFLAVSNYRINQKRVELNAQEKYLYEQLMILEQRENELQIQALGSESEEYLEIEARERFNLRKPGEAVVTVLPLEENEAKEEIRQWWNPFTW
jgi:cell division protein FtsB